MDKVVFGAKCDEMEHVFKTTLDPSWKEDLSLLDLAKAGPFPSEALEGFGAAAFYGRIATADVVQKERMEARQASMRWDPNGARIVIGVARFHERLGQFDEAKRVMEMVQSQVQEYMSNLEDYSALVSAGEMAFVAGEYDRAMVNFQAVLMKYPDAVHVKRSYAECCVKKKDFVKARKLLREILLTHSCDEEALALRAEILYLTGHLDSAIWLFVALLKYDPDNKKMGTFVKHARAVVRAKESGDARFRAHDFAEAIKDYTTALAVKTELNAVNSKIHCDVAACKIALNRWEEALADCNQAILLDVNNVLAYVLRAQCHTALSEHQKAFYDWRKAIELDPWNEDVVYGLHTTQLQGYKILEIEPGASHSEIRRAFLVLARKWHPDKHYAADSNSYDAAEARFNEICLAKDLLLFDPKARRQLASASPLLLYKTVLMDCSITKYWTNVEHLLPRLPWAFRDTINLPTQCCFCHNKSDAWNPVVVSFPNAPPDITIIEGCYLAPGCMSCYQSMGYLVLQSDTPFIPTSIKLEAISNDRWEPI